MFLKSEGIENVYVIGNKEMQKKYVRELGVTEEYFNTEHISADYVFECVGKNETVNEAIELAAPDGHIIMVGNPYSDMDISKDLYWKILRKQLKISGTSHTFSFYSLHIFHMESEGIPRLFSHSTWSSYQMFLLLCLKIHVLEQ